MGLLTPATRRHLLQLLAEIPHLANYEGRTLLLPDLPRPVHDAIVRSTSTTIDLNNIVDTCDNWPASANAAATPPLRLMIEAARMLVPDTDIAAKLQDLLERLPAQPLPSAAVGSNVPPQPADTELFAQQRADWDGPLFRQIGERGYWEMIIHPTDFVRDRIPRLALSPLLQRSAIHTSNDWNLPLLLNTPGERGPDWIGNELVRALNGVEAWRLYRSGQYVERWGFLDDWRDHGFTSPPAGWQPGQLLDIGSTVSIITLAFLLAARLAEQPEYQEVAALTVIIKAVGLQQRMLYKAGGRFLDHSYTSKHAESIHERIVARADLIHNPRKFALDVAEELFWLFGAEWDEQYLHPLQDEGVPPARA